MSDDRPTIDPEEPVKEEWFSVNCYKGITVEYLEISINNK